MTKYYIFIFTILLFFLNSFSTSAPPDSPPDDLPIKMRLLLLTVVEIPISGISFLSTDDKIHGGKITGGLLIIGGILSEIMAFRAYDSNEDYYRAKIIESTLTNSSLIGIGLYDIFKLKQHSKKKRFLINFIGINASLLSGFIAYNLLAK